MRPRGLGLSHHHVATMEGLLLRGCPVRSGHVARTPGQGIWPGEAEGRRASLTALGAGLQLGLGRGAWGHWWACLGPWSLGHARARLPTCVCFDNPGSLRSLSSHVRQPPL